MGNFTEFRIVDITCSQRAVLRFRKILIVESLDRWKPKTLCNQSAPVLCSFAELSTFPTNVVNCRRSASVRPRATSAAK